MNIVKQSKRVYEKEYQMNWNWKDDPDAGFSFPCDKEGNILTHEMQPAGLENLRKCRAGEHDVFGPILDSIERSWWECAEGECECGGRVYLQMSLTNTCDGCGREYNSSGQLLAPRNQWGWDTGESEAEIMQGNCRMGGDDG